VTFEKPWTLDPLVIAEARRYTVARLTNSA
jgi:hypothetical protein